MSRAVFLVREALANLRRNALIVFGAILAVFISLSIAFAALVVNRLAEINIGALQEGVHVLAFLHDEGQNNVPVGAHVTLQNEVETWEEVKSVRYVSKAEAWIEFQQIFANDAQMLEAIRDPTVLPASLRIELVDLDFHENTRARLLQQQQVVRRVVSSTEAIEQLQSLSRVARVLGIGAASVLGLAAVVLIANTIRLAIYARRDEVSIMKLVGASNWYIRVPFLMEGLIEGLVGAALAVFAVWLGSSSLARAAQGVELVRLQVDSQWFLQRGLLFLLFGALAGVIGSLLGLSRYLRDADGTGPDVPKGF